MPSIIRKQWKRIRGSKGGHLFTVAPYPYESIAMGSRDDSDGNSHGEGGGQVAPLGPRGDRCLFASTVAALIIFYLSFFAWVQERLLLHLSPLIPRSGKQILLLLPKNLFNEHYKYA